MGENQYGQIAVFEVATKLGIRVADSGIGYELTGHSLCYYSCHCFL